MALNLLQSYASDSSSEEEEDLKAEGVASGKNENVDTVGRGRDSNCNCHYNGKDANGLHHVQKTNSPYDLNGERENQKQIQKLPLPSVLKDMFKDKDKNPDEFDNPALHEGRLRSFSHVRGNWASFVCVSLNGHEATEKQVEILMSTLRDFPDNDIQLCSDFHLSLTKTLIFRHHWIDSFICSVKEKMCCCERFHIVFDEFEVYVNDEKTRTFIGMKVNSSNNLLNMIHFCDKILADFDLEPYYENPSFHVSIAWALGDQSSWLKKSVIPVLNSEWRKAYEDDAELQVVLVKGVQFKTGNKIYEFPLML